jgi:membrane protease YdiL (CAAX protease family)
MMSAQSAQSPPPRPWGYLATFGWGLLAAGASAVTSVILLGLWYPEFLTNPEPITSNGPLFCLMAITQNVTQLAVLALVVRLAHWPLADYLALRMPSRREAAFGLACIMAWALGYDALSLLLERDVVTPFQVDIYRSARDTGALALLWFSLVVVAPVGEEILFRGFLYRGWAQTPRAVWPAILVIAAAWSIVHVQYDWFGILQVFLTGIVLGWFRWRSGSTLLTVLMHGVMNAWATLETIIKVDWAA